MNVHLPVWATALLLCVGCSAEDAPGFDARPADSRAADSGFVFVDFGVVLDDARVADAGDGAVAIDSTVGTDGSEVRDSAVSPDTAPPCGSSTCDGCCDGAGVCRGGARDDRCGSFGSACVDCASQSGTCESRQCVYCTPKCTGKNCGASDECGGTCDAASSNCCELQCTGEICKARDGCGGECEADSSDCCTPTCTASIPTNTTPSDGCGGTCLGGAYSPIGFLDGITASGSAFGWACDKSHSRTSIMVHIYVGGPAGTSGAKVYAIRASTVSQAEVNTACGGGTAHRFHFAIPNATSGALVYAYGINIYGGSVNTLLSGSPKQIP